MTKLPKIPLFLDGIPHCNDACPKYSNTCVCEITGAERPDLCEPAVRDMLADLRDRLKLLAPYVCKRCGCAPVEIETYCGEVESTEFCEDCLLKHPDDAAASISRFCRAVAGRRLIP